MADARKSIASIRESTQSFDQEFVTFAAQATEECTKFTAELQKLLPDFANNMKPPASAELLKAIALTNQVEEVAAPAVSNAAQAVAAPPAPQKRLTLREEAAKYGLPDPGDDFDPAAPDAEEFLAKLKEARANAAKAATATASTAAAVTSAPAPETPAAKEAPPTAIKDINELWERTYSCQASQIKISLKAKKILAECDKADEIKVESPENAKALGDLSLTVKDLYDQMTSSPDVANVKKGIGLIKSKGAKVLKLTINDLKVKAAEAKRAADKAEEERLEKERLARLEAERKALIEKETTEIAAAFDAVAAQGCFRQLDWKTALRKLDNVSEFFKTEEGKLAKALQVRKVNNMKKVQDIFIAKLKGYSFKGKLKNFTVVSVDENEIAVLKNDKNAKKPVKISWQKFYKEFPGNFNEIINHFIVNGRKNSGLNLRDWADAMTGAALTMRLVCSEVTNATTRAEELAKEVVKQFPEYEKTMKSIFPDIDFAEASETKE